MKYFTAQQYESNILLHFTALLLLFYITGSDIHSSSIHSTHYCTSMAIAITWKCQTVMLYIQSLSCVMITNIHTVLSRPQCKTYTMDSMTTFLHSIGICRMQRFLAIRRSFFHSSLLCTFSCHPSPTTILPSSLTSSCHLFPLSLVVPKFIYNTL